jgi:sulfate adenylyltransferase subunit 2
MVDDNRLPLKPGETPEKRMIRFRTLGCYPLTAGIESNATTLDEIVAETLRTTTSERKGRIIDHDGVGSMERKKQEGYF